jgi:hypothetical protein
LDFKAYLGLVSQESKLLQRLYELSEQLEHRITELRDDRNLEKIRENERYFLELYFKHGGMTTDEFAVEEKKLKKPQCSNRFIDEQLQQIILSRAATQRKIDELHVQVAKRVRLILDGFDAWDVPPTSLLREHLSVVPPKIPDPRGAPKKTRLVKDKAFAMAIGGWYEDSHADSGQIIATAWERLGTLVQIRDFDLATFLSTKKAIKGMIDRLNSDSGGCKGTPIHTWSDLIEFVQGNKKRNAELRRILLQRFSEIYNTQYRPLMKSPHSSRF